MKFFLVFFKISVFARRQAAIHAASDSLFWFSRYAFRKFAAASSNKNNPAQAVPRLCLILPSKTGFFALLLHSKQFPVFMDRFHILFTLHVTVCGSSNIQIQIYSAYPAAQNGYGVSCLLNSIRSFLRSVP